MLPGSQRYPAMGQNLDALLIELRAPPQAPGQNTKEVAMYPIRLFCLCIAFCNCQLSEASQKATVQDLVESGSRSIERLQQFGGSWTAQHELGNGVQLLIDVTETADASRHVIRIPRMAGDRPVFSVIRKDGFWYVDNGKSRRRHLEFTGPLPFPGVLFMMQLSHVQFMTADIASRSTIEPNASADNSSTLVRVQLAKSQHAVTASSLKKLESLSESLKLSGKVPGKDAENRMDQLRDALGDGLLMDVDVSLGAFTVGTGAKGTRVYLKNIRIAESRKNQITIALDESEWEDLSNPIHESELPDLVQIQWNPSWKPGFPNGDMELMLLNVNGQFVRRVPYPYGLAMSGSFSPDRKSIYVSGTTLSGLGIFRIDLLTGRCEPIGGEATSVGVWMNPVVSPDGAVLAVSQVLGDQGSRGLDSQLNIIDLRQDTVRAIGPPMDAAFFMWHPDSTSLFFALRESDPNSKYPKSTLCRMAPEGTVHRIRQGSFPVLLPRQRRFLFEDESRNRVTCNLDGSDLREFSGPDGYGFPTPSRDGRLLMMKLGQKSGPAPCLIDMETNAVTPIKVLPGLWGRPAWQ